MSGRAQTRALFVGFCSDEKLIQVFESLIQPDKRVNQQGKILIQAFHKLIQRLDRLSQRPRPSR